MYERPILREHTAPFGALVPLAGFGLARAPALSASPSTKGRLLRYGLTLLVVAFPTVAGVVTNHSVAGLFGSALALALAGLVALGVSMLNRTIELY
jgi:hypothetical protein